MAELYDWGCDFNKVSVEIYENVRVEKIRMHAGAMETLRLIGGGKGALVSVTQKLLADTGAKMDESEGLAQDLRSISGVEFAAVLKEYTQRSTVQGQKAGKCGRDRSKPRRRRTSQSRRLHHKSAYGTS